MLPYGRHRAAIHGLILDFDTGRAAGGRAAQRAALSRVVRAGGRLGGAVDTHAALGLRQRTGVARGACRAVNGVPVRAQVPAVGFLNGF
ncbi:hypothetical protein [Streptomyces celluloflavus]|uniref:hypothetical protein n=1 Tax=Streptomyces celluloflavus TaxID=58344 RepID=UPI0036C1FEBE